MINQKHFHVDVDDDEDDVDSDENEIKHNLKNHFHDHENCRKV